MTKLSLRGLLLVTAFFAVSATASDRPNILMIVVDDLNDWVGVMNAHPNARTPNIDALAERGTLFTNAHAAAPICGPTRAAMLSGLRPSTTGIYGHINYEPLLENPRVGETTLLPHYFREHGYKTLATGKITQRGSPKAAFDEVGIEQRDFGPKPDERFAYTPPDGTGTQTDWGAYPARDDMMPDHASATWAIEQISKAHDRPFFLSVGFVRPHVPWYVPQKWFDMHPLESIILPLHNEGQFDDMPETAIQFSHLPDFPRMDWMRQEQRWEKSVQAYLASVSFVDHYVGEVLRALETSAHADDTIVMLWSDHGYHLGEKGLWAKHTLWEESTRVPLIIARPDDRKPRQTHRPVNHVDLYPTLLDLANLPPNPDNDGQSLVPLLDDPDAEGFESSLTTYGYGNHTVRTERWRYIRYEDGAEELYDHFSDPNEWRNLAGRSQYKDLTSELRSYLPSEDAPWDPNSRRGSHTNDYLSDLFDRTRADR